MVQKYEYYHNKTLSIEISIFSIIINLVLAVLKVYAGIVGKSKAMISDAIHSASDVLSTVIVIVGISMAYKNSDEEHQYGHERMECVASLILAMALFETGILIGINSVRDIFIADEVLNMPGEIALAAAIISIITKELMYRYTMFAARRIQSDAMRADAWHHRSDALSSIGALIGIFFARNGYPVFDHIAGIVICLFIVKASFDIFRDAIDKMIDKSCDKNTMMKMINTIKCQEGVEGVDIIKTRLFGTKVCVDVEVKVSGNISVVEGHNIAHKVNSAIEEEFPTVKHVMVHVNPCDYCKTS